MARKLQSDKWLFLATLALVCTSDSAMKASVIPSPKVPRNESCGVVEARRKGAGQDCLSWMGQ